MFIANDKKGRLIYIDDAVPGEEYFCPSCGEKVCVKDGCQKAKHFAHVSLRACDDFSHDMSEWHKSWQEKFPVENREVVVSNGKERHRADVLIGKYVIEFQHSPISADEVSRRNDFYTDAGYEVIWVFDVVDAYDAEYIIISDENRSLYTWKYANKALSAIIPQNNSNIAVILQFSYGDEKYAPWLVMVEWASEHYDEANYKYFIIDDFFSPDLFTEDGLDSIMLTKKKRFEKLLRDNRPYKQKCSRMKGKSRSWYICEKNGAWHDDRCESCPYNLIREYRRKTPYSRGGKFYYCCYPRIIHDIDHTELPDHERTPTIII